jgi:predicted DNA-binding protein (UPF0251 family)
MKPDLQPVSANGIPIGEAHHNAKLTDREVELLRRLHEEGIGYRRLSLKFEISRSQVRRIVCFEKRATAPAGWRIAPMLRIVEG